MNPTTMGRRMSDSRSIPIVKNMEPDHLEECIKRELVSLGLCDETEVTICIGYCSHQSIQFILKTVGK